MNVCSRMLVAVDGASPSNAAVRLALEIAHIQPQAAVRFASVFMYNALVAASAPQPWPDSAFDATLQAEQNVYQSALTGATSAAQTSGIDASAILLSGHPIDELLAEAEAWNATCIVIGTHNRSELANALLGSCADGVLRRSIRPVLITSVLQGSAAGSSAAVLCAFDGSAQAQRAFEAALTFVEERQAELHIVSVVQLDELYATSYEQEHFDPDGSIGTLYEAARRALAPLVADALARGVRAAPHVVGGADVASIIAGCATRYRCGIVMMGTHSRSGLRLAVLGSTAESVIRSAVVPVLAFHENTSR